MLKNDKKVLSSIVLIAILAFVGYLLISKKPNTEEVVVPTDWKTYEGEYFTIKYPGDWAAGVSYMWGESLPVEFCPTTLVEDSPGAGEFCKMTEDGIDSLAPIYILGHELTLVNKEYREVYTKMLSTFKFTPLPSVVETKTMNVDIMVPEDIDAYKKAMYDYTSGGKPNPSINWPFVKKTVSVISKGDLIEASAQAAAEQIDTQAGKYGAQVAYFKIENGTAYILLTMELDSWAGVSISTAMIHPFVEKTLLQFPQITSVKFSPAPGDKKEPNLPVIPFDRYPTS